MKVYAHRGLHDQVPSAENTRQAVTRALESSAHGIEVDLQLTGDGRFLLYHDDLIDRTCLSVDREKPVNTVTQADLEIERCNLIYLSDLLEFDWNNKQVVVECKPSRNRVTFARRLTHLLDGISSDKSLTVSTQDLPLLRELLYRTSLPVVPVIYEIDPLVRRYVNRKWWPEIHLDEALCRSEVLAELKTDPSEVLAWTVNDLTRTRELERLGIKGIMTDNLNLLPGNGKNRE